MVHLHVIRPNLKMNHYQWCKNAENLHAQVQGHKTIPSVGEFLGTFFGFLFYNTEIDEINKLSRLGMMST